jgi:tetratricopeptide (TPR) repeat protein
MPKVIETSRIDPADETRTGPHALYAAAVRLWREGRRDEAIRRLDDALRLKPDFAHAFCLGG